MSIRQPRDGSVPRINEYSCNLWRHDVIFLDDVFNFYFYFS